MSSQPLHKSYLVQDIQIWILSGDQIHFNMILINTKQSTLIYKITYKNKLV